MLNKLQIKIPDGNGQLQTIMVFPSIGFFVIHLVKMFMLMCKTISQIKITIFGFIIFPKRIYRISDIWCLHYLFVIENQLHPLFTSIVNVFLDTSLYSIKQRQRKCYVIVNLNLFVLNKFRWHALFVHLIDWNEINYFDMVSVEFVFFNNKNAKDILS